MLENFYPLLIGIMAGIHAASYGAYKDSPYEGFKPARVVRELLIASAIGLLFSVYQWAGNEEYVIVFLVIFALSRCITEFYKLFIRTENQSLYKIPTQIHLFGKIINSRLERLFIGVIPILGILGIYILGEYGLAGFPILIKGLILGFLIGLGTAIAGSYKDGFFEGFDTLKFLRSPLLGILGGLFASRLTDNVFFIILSAVGIERVIVELYKTFIKKGYWPGKFGSSKVHHKDWLEKRMLFVPFYFASLFFLLYLFRFLV